MGTKGLEEKMSLEEHLKRGEDLMDRTELRQFIAFPLQVAITASGGFLGYECFGTPGAVVGTIGSFVSFPFIAPLALSYIQEYIKKGE